MTDPSVSVVLCTFNGASYIGEQIDSILGQSHPPDEIVIADDGSSDETLEIASRQIARAASTTRPQLEILKVTDGLGAAGNFSRALAAASADVVFLADQDDVWRRDKIEWQMEALARHPRVLLSASNARLLDAAGDDVPTAAAQGDAQRLPPSALSRIPYGRRCLLRLRTEISRRERRNGSG